MKKGQRKLRGKQVILEDLSKQWEKNEKNGRDKNYETLIRNNSFTMLNMNNLTGSTSLNTSVQALGSCSSGGSTPGLKHSPRIALAPLEHTPSLKKLE